MLIYPKIKVNLINKASSSSVPKPRSNNICTIYQNSKAARQYKLSSTEETPTLDINSSESTSVLNEKKKKNYFNKNTNYKPKILSIIWVNNDQKNLSNIQNTIEEDNSNFLNFNLGNQSNQSEDSLSRLKANLERVSLNEHHHKNNTSYHELEYDLSNISHNIRELDDSSNYNSYYSIYNKDISELKPNENIHNIYKMNVCFTYTQNINISNDDDKKKNNYQNKYQKIVPKSFESSGKKLKKTNNKNKSPASKFIKA